MPRRLKLNIKELRENLAPVFVIGANRSGTSIITSIISQHPDLEGIFGHAEIKYDEAGHSIGFCESMHIWPQLMPLPEIRDKSGHLPYWALPQYIGLTYRNKAKTSSERNYLAWRMQRFRHTSNAPLIKDQFNTLRIGLIADVFPHAKFILCCRSLKSFISGSLHKWSNDRSGTSFERPLASFHWDMVNTVARYDLEIYFPGQYTIAYLDDLQESEAKAGEVLERITSDLALPPYEFNLSELARNWKKTGSEKLAGGSFREKCLDNILGVVQDERKVIERLRRLDSPTL